MSKTRIGKLKPQYSFILNPDVDTRLSRCPKCEKLTYLRKFVLFILIKDFGSMTLRKTCRYCSKCELIMAHQDELEAQLSFGLQKIDPQAIDREYFVVGTFDKKVWKRGLEGEPVGGKEMFDYLADFKKVMDLQVKPGGWYRD